MLGITPTEAAWFDDGSFARWVLAVFPDPADVVDDLGELLAPAVVDLVRRVAQVNDG